jgi:hypothetical protein
MCSSHELAQINVRQPVQILGDFLRDGDLGFIFAQRGIGQEVAKQTPRKMDNRRFIPMEAALRHWLGPYRKKEGLLVPLVDSAVRRRMKKLCLHSKVNPPNNALRHSYASYWLARSSKEGLG